ncbi:Bifunctional hemolysin/adenylate cyclase [Methylobacterium bullatum]|uniref:Bifunctional hemolysin/adenylate cyclase n=1 Tax=Methylobacterium bullatum TaxID=570505 RepID=A0A679JE21_9HYPH|nr:Bifunctional hemolysin/adenylate cyclase [Methylobacterium bullatum]
MPTFSFTYNSDYDPLDTVTLSQDGSLISSGTNNLHAFGPLGGGWFIFNNSSNLSQGGMFFSDANRDESGNPGYDITGTEYSVSADMSDNTASVYLEGGDFGDILRAGFGADTLKGGSGNDVLEGGADADTIEGGLGNDTASYEHAGGGVYVRLDSMLGYGGEAQDDELFGIENLAGSAFDDSLIGDDNNNTLRGNGGLDDIAGRDGDDRIVVSSTPGSIGGDGGKDVLIVMGGGTVSLSFMNFDGIEAIYVRNDTHLHMTNVLAGSKIVSQSTSGHAAEIVGTSGHDTIKGGKGGDTIDGGIGDDTIRAGQGGDTIDGGIGSDRLFAGTGGATIDGGIGSDKLFAGTGADSFRFEAGFGRDNIYGLDLNADHIFIDVAGVGDIVLRSLNNGRHTLVTFDGMEGGNKIILRDMNVDDVRNVQNELFLFGV